MAGRLRVRARLILRVAAAHRKEALHMVAIDGGVFAYGGASFRGAISNMEFGVGVAG